MHDKTLHQAVFYIENLSLGILAVFLFFLPIFFLNSSTDAFVLPKQMLLIGTSSLCVMLFAIKTILEGKIKLRTTPFDLPILLLVGVNLVSSILAINKPDAFTSFVPFLFTGLLFFVITNTIKNSTTLLIMIASLVLGGVAASALAVLSFLKIYPLPFSYTQVQNFSSFGSLLDQAIYLALILPISAYFVHAMFMGMRLNKKTADPFSGTGKTHSSAMSPLNLGFSIAFVILLSGLAVTAYQLITTNRPLILPLEAGFQTAFASISQDSGRVFWGFLFGSGPGTYLTDFTRFKPDAYNLDPNLWAFTFFRSSTYALETLATTGILGILAFLFLVLRIIREKSFFLPVILAILSSLLLPYSFTLVILFYVLVGIFAVIQAHNNPKHYEEIELFFVALKRGLLAIKPENEVKHHENTNKYSKMLPVLFLLLLAGIIAVPLYFAVNYFISDITYQNSLTAYAQNNAQVSYRAQEDAIKRFPYRDLYYRGFSQTNLAIATALAQRTQGEQPNEQDQQNIIALIQQAIGAAKNAAILSPQTSFNWTNLSNIYRNLIGFGDGADRFAISSIQQALVLDPKNPMLHVDLGGIYYQIQSYDEAIRQFQLAISLKNDYANAYYNLGHALEMKGDFDEALSAYKIVQTLVAGDEESLKKISEEIAAVEEKIRNSNQPQDQQAGPAPSPDEETAANNESNPLNINDSKATLPERNPRVKIPGPTISPEPTEKTSPTPGITVSPTPNEEN